MNGNSYGSKDPTKSVPAEMPAMFKLGGPDILNEHFEGNSHWLVWRITEDDRKVSHVAGWDKFPVTITDDTARLEIPEATRNAGSVLGGVEAWVGEKKSLVTQFCDYALTLYREFGQVDVNASLGSMGVSQTGSEKQVFFAPPHRLSSDTIQIADWISFTEEDLAIVVNGDPNLEELVAAFRSKLNDAGLKGK